MKLVGVYLVNIGHTNKTQLRVYSTLQHIQSLLTPHCTSFAITVTLTYLLAPD